MKDFVVARMKSGESLISRLGFRFASSRLLRCVSGIRIAKRRVSPRRLHLYSKAEETLLTWAYTKLRSVIPNSFVTLSEAKGLVFTRDSSPSAQNDINWKLSL